MTLGATLIWREGGTDNSDRGVGFLPRPDGDGVAADRLPRRGALSGLAGAADRRGLPRDQRAAERFRLRLGRGAARARCRRPLHARRASASAPRPPCRCGSMRWRKSLQGQRFDEAKVREAVKAALADIEADGRPARLGRIPQARRRRRWPFAPSPMPIKTPRGGHEGRARHQQARARGRSRAAHEPARLPARQALLDRRACRLRAWRLRRLHRAGRRRGGALLPDVRGAGRRLRHHHHRGAVARAGRAVADAGRVLRNPRHAMRLLHAGDDPCRACAAVEKSAADARGDRRRHLRQHLPLHRLCADRRGHRARGRAHARPERSRRSSHERAGKIPLRLVRPPGARGSPLRRRQGQFRRRHRAAGRQACRAGDVPASGGAHRLDRQVRGAGDARRALRAGGRASLPARPTCSPPASIRRTCRAIRWR